MNNFHAGEARHMLDWLWGINLSRALTSAIAGHHTKALSIGRVQGPTLAILATREREIGVVQAAAVLEAFPDGEGGRVHQHEGGDIRQEGRRVRPTTPRPAGAKEAHVSETEEKEQLSRPYPPFDLTSLQLEASRVLRYDPSSTLAVAQSLYERSYISYPRTASQKLPPTLGLTKIIGELAKNPQYEKKAKILIAGEEVQAERGHEERRGPSGDLPDRASCPRS